MTTVRKLIDYGALQSQLAAVNWSTIFTTMTDVDHMWEVFQNVIVKAIESCTTVAELHSRGKTRRIRALFLRKRRRWQLWRRKPTQKNKVGLDLATEDQSKAIQQDRRHSEEQLLNTTATKFFRYVSSRLQQHEPSITLKDSCAQYVKTDEGICDAFTNEFVKNYNSSPSVISVDVGATENSSFQVDLCMPALLSVIRDLPNAAAGPDGISAAIYKRYEHYLAYPLLCIFQQSLTQGRVPVSWKIARVIALYKGKGEL